MQHYTLTIGTKAQGWLPVEGADELTRDYLAPRQWLMPLPAPSVSEACSWAEQLLSALAGSSAGGTARALRCLASSAHVLRVAACYLRAAPEKGAYHMARAAAYQAEAQGERPWWA